MSFYDFVTLILALIGAAGTILQTYFNYDSWKTHRAQSVTSQPASTTINQAPRRSIFRSTYLWILVFAVVMFLGPFAFAGRSPERSGINSGQTQSAPQSVRLSVVGLSVDPPSESAFFQIKVIVNGKAFTLPRNGGWLPGQSVIRNQSLALPPLSRYAIQFELRKRDAYFPNATPATLEGNGTVRYAGGETSGTYVLKGFDTASPTGGGTVSVTVAYSLVPTR